MANNHSDAVFIKPYRLRQTMPGKNHVSVTFPYEVVNREARRHNMSVSEFVTKFHVVAEFDGFDGVRYRFTQDTNNEGACDADQGTIDPEEVAETR